MKLKNILLSTAMIFATVLSPAQAGTATGKIDKLQHCMYGQNQSMVLVHITDGTVLQYNNFNNTNITQLNDIVKTAYLLQKDVDITYTDSPATACGTTIVGNIHYYQGASVSLLN